MKCKRGSHVGVIASFSIFILFLVGFYLATEPALKLNKDKEALLQYLEGKINEEFSGNLTTVLISNLSGGSCGNLSTERVEVPLGSYALVKDNTNTVIASEFRSNSLFIDNNFAGEYLKVYYSNVPFTITQTTDSGCDVPAIESIRNSQEIFQAKIEQGIGNFSFFKSKLNFPDESQFSISFQYNNGTIISAGEMNVTQNVFEEEKNMQYTDNNANSLAGKLAIKVW